MLCWSVFFVVLAKSDSMIGQTFMLQFELLEWHFKISLSPIYCRSLFLLPMFFICRSDKLESLRIRNSPSWSHCVEPHEVTIYWNYERIQILWDWPMKKMQKNIALLSIISFYHLRKFSNSAYQISPQEQGIRDHNKLLDERRVGWIFSFNEPLRLG